MSGETCNIPNCTDKSEYLMPPEGDLCPRHMGKRHPDTKAYLDATKTNAEP